MVLLMAPSSGKRAEPEFERKAFSVTLESVNPEPAVEAAFEMPQYTTIEPLQSLPLLRPTEVVPTPQSATPVTQTAQVPPATLPVEEYYHKSSELDDQPIALWQVTPEFPPYAIEKGVDGWVRLLLLIDEEGRLRHIEVVESSPQGIFDDAALTAFRSMQFEPGRKLGRPVKSRMILKVDFNRS